MYCLQTEFYLFLHFKKKTKHHIAAHGKKEDKESL